VFGEVVVTVVCVEVTPGVVDFGADVDTGNSDIAGSIDFSGVAVCRGWDI